MQNRGFLANLFDFSFSDLVTPVIIKFLYAVGIALAAVGAIVFIAGGFRMGIAYGVGTLVLSPIIFLLYTVMVRVYMEILIVLFRISRDVREIAERGKAGG